jgi:formylglycine-generating enzyme required for sulfatase activity
MSSKVLSVQTLLTAERNSALKRHGQHTFNVTDKAYWPDQGRMPSADDVRAIVEWCDIPGDNKKQAEFKMSKYMVTRCLYDFVMGLKSSSEKDVKLEINRAKRQKSTKQVKDFPIHGVSLIDAMHFCNRLSLILKLEPVYLILKLDSAYEDVHVVYIKESNGVRLPNPVEWDYAAKANSKFRYAGSDDPNEVAWTQENSGGKLHKVGQLKPNGWNLYDMTGNLWEYFISELEQKEGIVTYFPSFAAYENFGIRLVRAM